MVMKFHAQSESLIIPLESLKRTALNIRYSMKAIRELAGLPLDRYEVPGALSEADHAQQRLITVARDLGIDLGSEWAHEIDLRDLRRGS